MTEEVMAVDEPTKVDLAASEACVRSGSFALLISVALLLLIPSWREQRNYAALRRYVSDRLALASMVDRGEDDPFWQKYKASNAEAESMSIADLLSATVVVSTTETKSAPAHKVAPSTHHHAQTAKGEPLAPSPPTSVGAVVTVAVGVDEIKPIADALGRLNDSDVLTRTRLVSNFYNFSLFRWTDKRNFMAYRNQIFNKCFAGGLEVPNQVRTSDRFVPAIENDGLLKCLTFKNVQELAKMELPTFVTPQLGDHVGSRTDVQLGEFLPHDLYWASILAQLLLFLIMVHFGAFVREAALSAHFPAPGTVFGAFSRSRMTLLIFGAAIFVPLLASVLVLWASWATESIFHSVCLLVCTLLIVWAFFSIQLVLLRTSYFKSLIQIRK
jgi:hypothetical protein